MERKTSGVDTIEIRVLNRSDAAAYRELRLHGLQSDPDAFASTYEENAGRTADTFARQLEHSALHFSLGALAGSRLAGIVSFVRSARRKMHHKGTVVALYVHPECRTRGVGRMLMEALIEGASAMTGLEQIQLTVVSSNAPAVHLYRKLGFEPYGFEQRAMKTETGYLDETRMVLHLK